MKYKSFILLTTAMYFAIVECDLAPDINLEGSLITNNATKVLQLVCSTNIAVQLCTVEFLIDEKTHDNIRYYDNNCYHTMWICSPNVCKCSDDCMSFTLNVTVTEHMMNHSFSCATRIETDSVTYLANISVKHDGNEGFTLFQKIIVPYRSMSSTQRVTTYSPELTTSSSLSAPLIIAVAAVAFLSFVILVIILFMTCRRFWNSKTETRAELSNTISITENTSDEVFHRIELESHTDVSQFDIMQRYSQADSGISCISYTRPLNPLQITLEAVDPYPIIPELIDTGNFGVDPYPIIPELIDTGNFGADPDLRISDLIDTEADPDLTSPELIDARNFGDSTSYITQSSSRSSPLETELLFDSEPNRCIWRHHNSCSILSFQDSDN